MFRHLSTKAKHNCPGKPKDPIATQIPHPNATHIVHTQAPQIIEQREHTYTGIEVYDTVNKETIII